MGFECVRLQSGYTKTSKSADFGTKENTADCEIRRFRGLQCIVHAGTKAIFKVHIFSTKLRRFQEILNESITNSKIQLGSGMDFTKI